MICPCCGEHLICEKETEKLKSYRCLSCGLKNTELKESASTCVTAKMRFMLESQYPILRFA